MHDPDINHVRPGAEPSALNRTPPRPNMQWVPGGIFLMGSNRHYAEEAPAHRVLVDGFWMDRCPVTNAEFAQFVADTGYVTAAERSPRAEDYPDAPAALLVPGSAVFKKPPGQIDPSDGVYCWQHVPGAHWRHPEGLRSNLVGRQDHPVVHVTYADVEAYARWAGKEIPAEAEWERAARGGIEGAEFCWGNEPAPGGRMMANTWQGAFPWDNRRSDGFEGTAPVGSFPPNGYGLYDMAGNVWEWTSDWFVSWHAGGLHRKSCCMPVKPRGPGRDESQADGAAIPPPRKVLKGGSFLCSPDVCMRYRPAARYPETIDTCASHIGFRLLVRPT